MTNDDEGENTYLVLIVVTTAGNMVIIFVGVKLRFGNDKKGEQYQAFTQTQPSILFYVQNTPHP